MYTLVVKKWMGGIDNMSMAINWIEDHCHMCATKTFEQGCKGTINDTFHNITNVYVAYYREIWMLSILRIMHGFLIE